MNALASRLAAVQERVTHAEITREMTAVRLAAAAHRAEQADADVRACDVGLAALHSVRDATSARVQETIASLCSEALRIIFDDPSVRLEARSVERRGVVEVDLVLVRGELETDPMNGNGGGLIAAAAAMLRLVLVRLMGCRGLVPLLILDEPLAAVSVEHREQMATVLREVAADLGIQVIVISHEQELSQDGDTWQVRWADRDAVRAEVVRVEA